jgi:hypothetical protein
MKQLHLRKALTYLRQSVMQSRAAVKYCFLHIPKTGGTSLGSALNNKFKYIRQYHYPASRWRKVYANVEKKSVFETHVNNSYRLHGIAEIYHNLKMHYAIVGGHFFYHPAFDEFLGEYKFLTIIRHPVERFISQYKYSRIHDGSLDDCTKRGLFKYLCSDAGKQKANCISAMIGGYTTETQFSTDGADARAIERLKKFSFVGIADQGKPLDDQMQAALGIKLKIRKLNTLSDNKNVCKERYVLLKTLFDAEAVKAVTDTCQLDLAVYKYFAGLPQGS